MPRKSASAELPPVYSAIHIVGEIDLLATFLIGDAFPITVVRITRETEPMSLPALEDIAAHSGSNQPIEGVTRIETSRGRKPLR